MVDPVDSPLQAALRLLAQEVERAEVDAWAVACGGVYQILSAQLSPVIGVGGVLALLTRAVKLNRREFPCLAGIVIPTEPGDEEGQVSQVIARSLGALERESGLEAATALYGAFLGLLCTFIGERLTWQLVQRAFTDAGTAAKETE